MAVVISSPIRLSLLGAIAVSTLLAAGRADSQPVGQGSVVSAGRAVYLRECASCHGAAATGYGHRSWLLKQMPPDLTRLTDRTTPFPRENIRRHVTGHIRREPSYHTTQMPVWRTSLNTAVSGQAVTQMDALLEYLNSIQAREFGPYRGPTPQMLASAGLVLFETHCLACHGKDGRGQPQPGYVVGIGATDLTVIAARNAGTFDQGRVYESIARCGDDWGPSEMPAWERAFKRAGWPEYLTMKNLEALAAYLESIQR
jgi:mono/diheme cytochrome c family protein